MFCYAEKQFWTFSVCSAWHHIFISELLLELLNLSANRTAMNQRGESCRSVTKLCLTRCDPVDCSTLGSSVLHYLPKFAQTRVHWVGDATDHLILHCLHLLLPSIFPSVRVFQWVSSSHQVAKALKLQVQCQSFQWIFRVYFFREGLGGSPCSPRDSQDSSAPQFESLNSSALNSKIYIIRSYMWGCSQLNYYSINKPLI